MWTYERQTRLLQACQYEATFIKAVEGAMGHLDEGVVEMVTVYFPPTNTHSLKLMVSYEMKQPFFWEQHVRK